jgi:hypothetical protein
MSRFVAVLRRGDDRERAALVRHRASLQRAVDVMPGDETLRRLLAEADRMLKGELPQ